MSKQEKVSFKSSAVIDNVKKVETSLKDIRNAISNMPDCGIKKSYMVSLTNFESKVNAIVKKEQIDLAMKAIRKNPDILNSLSDEIKARFASNPEEAVETNSEINESVQNVKKSKKHWKILPCNRG